MSLLMDALKRAETGKESPVRNLTDKQPSGKTPDFSLEPLPARPANAGPALPKLTQHIDSLNAELEASAPHAQSSAPAINTDQPPPSEEANRAAIRNAFAAKESKAPSRKPRWLVMLGLGVAAVSIGEYAWYQNQRAVRAANSPPPAASAALPAQPATAPASLPAVPIFAPNSPSTARFAENPERRGKPAQRADHQPNQEPENKDDTPIRLIRSQPEPDPHAQRGYANLQGNSLDQARHDYEQALQNDPNHVDALLGLAAIAQRQGRSSDAERYQQRALLADPLNPGAQAAVLGSIDNGNPAHTESRLKSLLSAQPESAQLSFALGNLYAKQARWSEAQQVYFDALAGDSDNPDYLFNLAVSLDQLHQPKLAAQHYRMALEAADRRPAAFDRQRTQQRLSQLSR